MTTLAMKRPKATDLRVELVEITPSIASAMLDRNEKNRTVNKSHVRRLASDIAAGRWRITGEPIKFGPNGELLDGQHRLLAVVAAERSIRTLVVYDLPTEVQEVMDTGRARSTGDVLSMGGTPNATNLATALRCLLSEKAGITAQSAGFTTAELMEAHRRHPRLGLYLPHTSSMPRGISIGMVGFIRYAAATIIGGAADGEALHTVLRTGVPSYEGDAIHKFREKLINARGNAEQVRHYVIHQTLKSCWNKFVNQEPVHRVQWSKEFVPLDGVKTKDL